MGTGKVVNRAELAEICGVSVVTIDNWVRDGAPFVRRPVRKGVGQWEFSPGAVVQWRIDRERQSALGDLAQIDEMEARRRKLAAEAGLAELELQKANGAAVAIEDQERIWVQMVGAARAKLLSIPTKLGPSLAIEVDAVVCQAMVDGAITEALTELSGFDPAAVEEVEDDVLGDQQRIQDELGGAAQFAGCHSPDGVDLGAAAEADRKRVGRPRKTAQPGKQ